MSKMKQAEFARLIGVERSYITALKKAGRLVMDAEGLVDVEASKARIAETADPNRDDVKARHAAARGDAPEEAEEAKDSGNYADARARKEHALADIAEMDRDQKRGALVEKSEVSRAVEDVVAIIRQALENMPHRASADLVGKDLDAIRAILKQEVHGALSEMEREFGVRISHLGVAE